MNPPHPRGSLARASVAIDEANTASSRVAQETNVREAYHAIEEWADAHDVDLSREDG